MKRSRLVTLMILGAATLVAGCEEEKDQQLTVFKDVDDCVSSKAMTEDQCKNAFKAADEENVKNGPKYNSRELCEQEYGAGQCNPRTVAGHSESVFMPMMTGFMAAQVLNSINNGNGNCNAMNNYCNPVAPQPLYRSSRDYSTYRTQGGYSVPAVSNGSSISARSVSVKPSVATSVNSTGGFGSQAAARSSWSGGSMSSSGG